MKKLLFIMGLLCSLNSIAQTPRLYDVLAGSDGSYPEQMTEYNGNLYFVYEEPNANYYDVISYISNAGEIVKPIYDLPDGLEVSSDVYQGIYEMNGKIYFLQDFYDNINSEDYYSRFMVLDNDTVRMINTDLEEEIYEIIRFNDKIYASQYSYANNEYSILSYDGFSFNLENIDEVANPTSTMYDLGDFFVVNNKFHFTKLDFDNFKTIIYHTDGVDYQTDTLNTLGNFNEIYYLNNDYYYVGNFSPIGESIIKKNANDSLVFVDYGIDNLNGVNSYNTISHDNNIYFKTGEGYVIDNKICRYDAVNDTILIMNAENQYVGGLDNFAVLNNEVYLSGSISNSNSTYYIGVMDIVNDTILRFDFTDQDGDIKELKAIGNDLYFTMYNNNYGFEAYKFDGTLTSSLQLVDDLYPGSTWSYPYDFFSFEGNVGFVAYVDNGNELYILCSNNTLPIAPTTQIACEKSIIADLNVTGTNLTYHSASTGGTILNENTLLTTSGSIYVASNIVCPSNRVEVPYTVSILPNNTAAYLGDSLITVINPTTTYQWIDCSNDQAISNATAQTFKAPGNGSYKCLLTNQDGCAIETNCINIINLSINENEMNNTKVYPNPSFDILHIDSDENMKSITLKSINGATIHSAAVNAMQHTIDVSALSEGIYFLEILNENNVIVSKQKIIVKK